MHFVFLPPLPECGVLFGKVLRGTSELSAWLLLKDFVILYLCSFMSLESVCYSRSMSQSTPNLK